MGLALLSNAVGSALEELVKLLDWLLLTGDALPCVVE